jgi:hypothetical protein
VSVWCFLIHVSYTILMINSYYFHNKKGNVIISVILKSLRLTTVAMENQKVLHILIVCL